MLLAYSDVSAALTRGTHESARRATTYAEMSDKQREAEHDGAGGAGRCWEANTEGGKLAESQKKNGGREHEKSADGGKKEDGDLHI